MSGSLLNPGLLLKSIRVFKLFLEYFYWGFLFCCLRRTPPGNIENSVGRMFIPAWEKDFRSLGCPLLYWGFEVELISSRVQVSQ